MNQKIQMPKYPNDRINGRIVLEDDNGNFFIPEFSDNQSNDPSFGAYKKKWCAWRQLSINCGFTEPCSLSRPSTLNMW